jgi:RNA recognition motif-containing protein
MNIHVSNLSSNIENTDLCNLFSSYGEVKSAEVAMDVFTGESRGFGHVEMEDADAAQKAIDELNNSELKSMTISVKEAEPKKEMKGSYKVGNGAVNIYRFRKN